MSLHYHQEAKSNCINSLVSFCTCLITTGLNVLEYLLEALKTTKSKGASKSIEAQIEFHQKQIKLTELWQGSQPRMYIAGDKNSQAK